MVEAATCHGAEGGGLRSGAERKPLWPLAVCEVDSQPSAFDVVAALHFAQWHLEEGRVMSRAWFEKARAGVLGPSDLRSTASGSRRRATRHAVPRSAGRPALRPGRTASAAAGGRRKRCPHCTWTRGRFAWGRSAWDRPLCACSGCQVRPVLPCRERGRAPFFVKSSVGGRGEKRSGVTSSEDVRPLRVWCL